MRGWQAEVQRPATGGEDCHGRDSEGEVAICPYDQIRKRPVSASMPPYVANGTVRSVDDSVRFVVILVVLEILIVVEVIEEILAVVLEFALDAALRHPEGVERGF